MNNNQIRTRAAIVDRFLAKEDIESLAEDYDLTTAEVRAVIDRVPVDLRKMFARNEFYVEVDGFLAWWPSKTGFVDSYRLRSIADFLDEENAEWRSLGSFAAIRAS